MKSLTTEAGKKLLDAVMRQPTSPARLRALGDWLRSKRDPLGDFIITQLDSPGSVEERKLQIEHYETWMGPLKNVVDPFSVKFRGGFLRECSLGYLDGSYSDLTPRWLKQLSRAAGCLQTSFIETLVLGKGVGMGTAQSTDDEGHVAAVIRTSLTRKKIPVVAFIVAPTMKRLKKVVVTDDLAPNVESALRTLRPKLVIESR